MRLPTGRRLAGRRRPAAVRQNSPLSETDNLVECAPGGGQITGWELTEAAGLSKDGSHGQAPHSQHWAAQEWNRSSQRLVRTLGSSCDASLFTPVGHGKEPNPGDEGGRPLDQHHRHGASTSQIHRVAGAFWRAAMRAGLFIGRAGTRSAVPTFLERPSTLGSASLLMAWRGMARP